MKAEPDKNPAKNVVTSMINYKIILVGFYIFLFVFVFTILFIQINDPITWVLGDWLVNYSDGGFKRRGLSGNIFFVLQDLTGLQLTFLVFCIQVTLYGIFLIFFLKLIWDKLIGPYFLTLVLSPLTFLFMMNKPAAIGRKEIIIIVIFTFFVYLLSKKQLDRRKEISILILLSFSCLLHELIVFYIPFFLLALYVHNNKKVDLKRWGIYLASVGIPTFILWVFGGPINQGSSLEILNSRGVALEGGIYSWTVVAYQYIWENLSGYSLYFVCYLIGVIHFYFFASMRLNLGSNFLKLYGFAILFSIPLFFLAIDWGRWLFIHFTLLVILLGSCLEYSKYWQDSTIKPDRAAVISLLIILPLNIWSVGIHSKGLNLDGGVFSVFSKIPELIIVF
ncbi:MAG: hypothetical protein AAF502_15740 [Bacteroidota bacterium]